MNFSYLKSFSQFKKLYEHCIDAEEFVITKPNISAASARKALEFIVKFLYYTEIPYAEDRLTVFEMLSDPLFKDYINDGTLLSTIHFIRKMGNVAAHDGNLTQEEGLKVLEELHFLVGEFCILLNLIEDYPTFQKPGFKAHTKEEEHKIAEKKKIVVEPELIAQYAPRMRNTKFNLKVHRDEEENKKMFLHASLREAGWPIVSQKNQAMPCSVGLNMLLDDGSQVDYILYGRDNKPLALVEYTTTTKNLVEGRMKGIEQANKISQKVGYKPVVYYTNGYYIYVIDQLGYKPRRVFQFHSIEELELLKLRASIRTDITNPTINDEITNRDYQKEAIRASCKAFAANRRHSLLVMATGTGKTRVSISLVDVLMKANWIKNVLFLADRTSLVRQAHKNYNKLLQNVTTSIYTGGHLDRDPNARIIFSTYQTMINLINDDTREFGIGRFDLIIIDEAHRSIFRKYGTLFDYFDSLMIGLTATPRNENNKNTYKIFELENGHPDFAYELEQAISENYLVGFSVLDKTTKNMKRGICYDELSEKEKEQFEDAFATGDDGGVNEDFINNILNGGSRIINLGTIDAMLNDLMKNGLKIEGGDKIGKTIIFTRSHYEAEKIVGRFQHLYSYLGADFCKLIDSQVPNSLDLIDKFGERDKIPQIAVSVDMMDTGIDVPDVLNLVFFKPVASKIKFLQMIGRGTRLSPDVFGPGMHKKGFIIFDYYGNFDFFKTRNTWSVIEEQSRENLLAATPQRLLMYQRKLQILINLTQEDSLSEYDEQYKKELKEYFIKKTRELCNDDIEVQYNMAYVNKYRTAEQWNGFTNAKIEEIYDHILTLFPSEPDPVKVKNFDLLIYVIEDEAWKLKKAGKDIRNIRHGFVFVTYRMNLMLNELRRLKTIPAILQKEKLIKKMRNADYIFNSFSLERCESVRKELRDLMQYIPDEQRYFVINTEDFVIEDIDSADELMKEKSYEEKAREFIEKGTPALAKIRNLDALTQQEKSELETMFKQKLGTEVDYASWSGNKDLLPFLRVQVGIADEAIQTKFGSFMNEQVLNVQQLAYMNQIISYARENGDITFMDLQRVSPFCDIDIMNLFGEQIKHIKTLINGIHQPIM